MKKFIKRTIIFLFAAVIIFSSSYVLKASIESGDATGTVTERTVTFGDSEFHYFMFVPDNSELLGKRATAAPVILVYGNEDYTAETAKAAAEESGLAKIAKDEGASIAFVNWSNVGDTNAVPLYKNAAVMFSDDTNKEFVDGFWSNIAKDSKGNMTEQGKYAGTGQRIYLYGEGKGADYVAKNYLIKQSPVTMTPASVTLVNPSIALTANVSDIEIPIAVVNSQAGTEAILKSYSEDKYALKTSTVTSGFDKELVISLYNDLSGKYRRQDGYIIEIPDYAKLGITETRETTTLSNGDVEYYQYVPDSINTDEKGSVPLVLIFHGGGNHAQYQAWASEWPLMGGEDGFMVVSVNQHDKKTASDIVELLDYLLDKYPYLDSTRVYASGFSMGSIKCWDLAEQYPDRFAGIAPMSGSFEASKEIPDVILPVFYVGGEATGAAEFPRDKTGKVTAVESRIDFVLKMNKVTDSYSYDATANQWWGIAPDETQTIENPTFIGSVLTLCKYKSEDGNIYTVFGSSSLKQHEVYANDNRAAWDFLKQFSRNADGTISIEGQSNIGDILIIVIPVLVVVLAVATTTVIILKKRKKKTV